MVGVPVNGQLAVYDATLERWIPQSGSISSTIKVEAALTAASFINQNPSNFGVSQQITFGDPVTTDQFSLDAAGVITCLETDEYTFRLRFGIGREGASGESLIYLRVLLNGVQFGSSAVAIVDNERIEIPATFEGVVSLVAGDIVTFEMVRDTDGNNSGGLRAGIPSVAGWNPSPSALVTITRFVAVSAGETP